MEEGRESKSTRGPYGSAMLALPILLYLVVTVLESGADCVNLPTGKQNQRGNIVLINN